MRAVIQRCNWCRVSSEGTPVSSIGKGLSVLLGVKKGDTSKDVIYIADKILHLRIFEDENGKLNQSILDVGGEISIVSQFTLYGDVRRGRRPSFTEAELPEKARQLYQEAVDYFRNAGINVGTGEFQTYMKVALENDGPVTILIDSDKIF
ncbi:D-aminoacyl-tRNA deacylase [uncultured Dialister sp.]|uniref:D-aminoacyl-tRNA deacylase n=1 Tax=uncultured Dialister sp. TaxID=278064 RepID=UPI0025DEA2F6|nr:D-aminoacyl-tRNA deacylase [uncultured Dialister sp.]